MADVEVSYKGSTIGSLSASGTLTLETEGKYCEDDITVDYTSPGGGASNFTLIGTKTLTLSEYTSTTAENTDTEIDIHNTDYAWLWVSITCDSAIGTSNEWGMTQQICGRRSNGKIGAFQAMQQFGWASLSYAALVNNTTSSNVYGVYVVNDNNTVVIARKCHTSNCPKIRAGTYTIKVYGLSSL